MHKFSVFVALAVALSGCGGEAVDATQPNANSQLSDTKSAASDTLDKEQEDAGVPIPVEYHGSWGVMGRCNSTGDIVTIGAHNMTWPGQGDGRVVNVKVLRDFALEAEEAPDPANPDADTRFGLTMSDDGQSLSLESPQHSSIGFTRCTPKQVAEVSQRPEQTASLGLPKKFHGGWGDTIQPENTCDPFAGDIMVMLADKIEHNHGTTRLSDIRKVNDRSYTMTAQYTSNEGETRPAVKVRFTLDEDGEFLTENIDGYQPFIYQRC